MNNNYSSQDFTTVYEELLAIVEASTTRWSPKHSTEADPGVVILKLMALLEDKHNFKFDMAQSQAYLDSVSDRQYAFDLLMMLGYIMKSARASTGKVQLSLTNSWEGVTEVTIPVGTPITDTTRTLRFFTTEEKTMASTTSTQARLSLGVQEGELFKITKEGIEEFTLKDIDEDGRLYLGKSGLAQNGVFVRTVGPENNKETADWEYIEFSIIAPQGKHYTVETAEDQEMYIQFPENFESLVGNTKLAIYATYTKGSAGNILKNTLSIIDNAEISKYFTVGQPDSFYTGQDTESIEQAKRNYYKTKDVCKTLVTASDFATAIKYLLDENSERLYSNALVDTALTRQLKIKSQCYDKEFIYSSIDSAPSYQIDVTPLQASSDYASSFKVATNNDTDDVATSYMSRQFENQRALATTFKIKAGPRILAVTTPKMTIRVSNYSLPTAAILQQKIKNYLYSAFKAENLQPGEPLNPLEMEHAIKQLSPDIQSVSIQELTYKTFSTYEPVDGKPSVRASIPDTSTATGVKGYQLEILADAALAGEVPLFKFYNRPNTPSKNNAGYTALAGSNENVEIFNPIPWGASGYTSLNGGKPIAPTISDLVATLPYAQQEPPIDSLPTTSVGYIALNENHVLQLRRKLHRAVEDYGYGMQYSFCSSTNPKTLQGIQILYSSKLLEGSILAGEEAPNTATAPTDKASIIVVPEARQMTTGASLWERAIDSLTWSKPALVTKLEPGKQYALNVSSLTIGQGGIVLAKESFIAAGSTITPTSGINRVTYSSYRIKDGQEYQLKADEVLYITKSDGTKVKTLQSGDWVISKGLDIPSSGATKSTTTVVGGQVLQATQSISVLADDESLISTNFKYFLSLNSDNTTLDLTKGKSYMLDEGEALLYSDSSVSEYVTLGPGTILSAGRNTKTGDGTTPNDGGELINTPIAEVESVSSEQFKIVPFEIHAQACEITTYLKPAIITEHSVEKTNSFPTTWTGLGGPKLAPKSITIKKSDKEDPTIYNSTDWDVRLAVKIQSDENGVAPIALPISFKINYKDAAGTDQPPVAIGGSVDTSPFIVASTPFTSLLSAPAGATPLLFQKGISAGVSHCTISPISTNELFNYTTSVNSLTITRNKKQLSVSEANLQTTINFAAGASYKMILATVLVHGLTTGTISITGSKLSSITTSTAKFSADSSDLAGTVIILPNNPDSLTPTLDSTIISFSIDAPEGASIELTNLSYVAGFSEEILYTKDTSGQALAGGAVDGFTEEVEGSALIKAIQYKDSGGVFNWLCTPKEVLQHPTASASYFTPGHPLKNKTLPFIDFNAQEIKIVRGN